MQVRDAKAVSPRRAHISHNTAAIRIWTAPLLHAISLNQIRGRTASARGAHSE